MNDLRTIRNKIRSLSRKELIAVVELLLPLMDRVEEIEKEVERLKNQNSRNSLLPPSRDKQNTKKKTRSLRRKSARKSGGQKGHPGETLKMVDRVDGIVEYPLTNCAHCSEDLSELEGSITECKQVWDIPPVGLQVTEHRRWKKHCTPCGKWSCSAYGQDLKSGPPVRYGDRIKNQLCYLHVRQLVPYQRLAEIM
jgi:transposase